MDFPLLKIKSCIMFRARFIIIIISRGHLLGLFRDPVPVQ